MGERRQGAKNDFALHPFTHSSLQFSGGEGGIRTHGTRKGTTVFETARFSHSRTSPHKGLLITHHSSSGTILSGIILIAVSVDAGLATLPEESLH
jgi:hypothetical protein